ncbi:MAG: fluoride efflux transporter CrcB [Sphingobacteriales bacterium]|nr:MAG: fluoride efflux transporter CrcB [Sphingobacteriales bacterium]
MLKNFLLVGLGGMIGSMLRYTASVLVKNTTSGFPIATFSVNIIGSFVIGWVFGMSLKEGSINWDWKLFLTTGICGGFTTFSALSLEGVALIQQQRYGIFATYFIASILAGLAAAWLGLLISK